MDQPEPSEALIDPEVRAFVFSLVSALGGSSAADDGRYVLGDDALAVLKDIKRWLRLYDDKTNRLDVARLLAEANLVKGDLLEILASWPEDAPEGSLRSKSALLCADLLTQLTWPHQKDEMTTTMHHLVHRPFLQTAQAAYKRAILHHDTAKILRTIMRVSLPAVAQSQTDRDPTQDSIIKVVLYLLRNVAAIGPPEGTSADEDMEISRSATIDAYHRQDIFTLILTIGSNLTEDYSTHDVELLDILFHLVKGVDVDRLFMDKDELMSANTRELQGLLGKEKSLLAGQARYASSRHNRFGTMMWRKRDGGRMSTVIAKTTAPNDQVLLHEMDQSKKWKKPRRPMKKESENPEAELGTTVPLTSAARRHLRSFVEQFLDSSFNPLFLSIRRSIEREVPRVLPYHRRQYFYLISWFLRAERARRMKQSTDRSQRAEQTEASLESFALVAAVLNQETFVLLNRTMQTAVDNKSWQDVTACMTSFTQILLTVHEMSESPLEEDQEISENTLNRIFYEQTTHDRIVAMLRTYKDQGFGYLDACTELAHVFLRLLERYSKQNVDMQVRSIRRARKKRQAKQIAANETADDGINDREVEADDVAEAQKTSSERKFDFHRFAAKFINQGSIDTFISFVKLYRELNTEQLKRAHRFLYRAAFKMDLSVFLFRADIILLLNKLIKGPEGMNRDDPTYRDWDELVRQVFRKMVKRMEERPALGVELLFSKIPSTLFYLEHGFEKKVHKSSPKLPAELEVKPGMDKDQQLGVAVSLLINQSKSDHLEWVRGVLTSASAERKNWEDDAETRLAFEQAAASEAQTATIAATDAAPDSIDSGNGVIQPSVEQDVLATASEVQKPIPSPILVRGDSVERRTAMQRDKYLRLLLTLLNFNKLDITDSDIAKDGILTSWTIPGSLSANDLTRFRDLIAQFEFAPPSYEDGKSAEDFVRRKYTPSTSTTIDASTSRRRGGPGRNADSQNSESDSEGSSLASDVDAALFPAGGPTPRAPDDPTTNKPRRRLNRHKPDKHIPDSVLEERRKARQKLERERAMKVKSGLFVSKSDDESDEERDRRFFEQEEKLRSAVGKKVAKENAAAAAASTTKSNKKKTQKRAASATSDADSTESDSEASRPVKRTKKQRARRPKQPVSIPSDTGSLDVGSDDDILYSPTAPWDRAVADIPKSPSTPSSDPIMGDDALMNTTADSEADTDTPASSQLDVEGKPTKALRAGGEDDNVTRSGDDVDTDGDGAMLMDDDDSDKENAGMHSSGGGEVRRKSASAIVPQMRGGRRTLVVDDDSDE